MARLKWPPEKTFKYEFNQDLNLEIQAFDNDKKLESKVNNTKNGQGREH